MGAYQLRFATFNMSVERMFCIWFKGWGLTLHKKTEHQPTFTYRTHYHCTLHNTWLVEVPVSVPYTYPHDTYDTIRILTRSSL